MRVEDQRFGLFPANAAVGDRDAVFEIGGIFRERLFALPEIAFQKSPDGWYTVPSRRIPTSVMGWPGE